MGCWIVSVQSWLDYIARSGAGHASFCPDKSNALALVSNSKNPLILFLAAERVICPSKGKQSEKDIGPEKWCQKTASIVSPTILTA